MKDTNLTIKAKIDAFKMEYPLDDGTVLVDNNPETVALAENYLSMMELEKAAVENKQAAQLALMEKMKYASELYSGPYKVTFKAFDKKEYVQKAVTVRAVRVAKTTAKNNILPDPA